MFRAFFAPPGSSVLSVQNTSCHWKESVAFTDHKMQGKNVLSRQLWQAGPSDLQPFAGAPLLKIPMHRQHNHSAAPFLGWV